MKYFSFLVIILAGFSCSPKLAPDAGWNRGRWVLVEMKEVPVQQSGSRKDAFIDFDVDQKKIRGNGGCNQFNGSYTIDKKSIKFSEVSSTKMSCDDIEFENAFLSTLGTVDRYEVRGDDLLLKRKKDVLLILRAK